MGSVVRILSHAGFLGRGFRRTSRPPCVRVGPETSGSPEYTSIHGILAASPVRPAFRIPPKVDPLSAFPLVFEQIFTFLIEGGHHAGRRPVPVLVDDSAPRS